MNLKDQKDTTSDTQVSPWYTSFLLPAGLIFLLLLAGALYFGYQSYSASKVPKLPTESPSNINYPQVSASGVTFVKSETVLNAEWFNEAYRKGDLTICDKITFEDRKQTCRDDVLSSQASKTGNLSICDRLSTDERKITCRNPIYFNEAVATKKTEVCKKIVNNDTYREQCVSTIILNQIKLATSSTGGLDITLCESVVDEYKDGCKRDVQAKNSLDAFVSAQSNTNINGCDAITDIALKNSCRDQVLAREAKSNNNIALCLKITDEDGKMRCQTNVVRTADSNHYRQARDNDDIESCNKIQSLDTKNKCNDTVYYSRALKNQDVNLCDKIVQSAQKSQCQSLINK